MATVLRRTPVGVDIRSFMGPWQIAGVTIDNPSGSWLSVPNVGSIPPYTMGWAASPTPTILTIDVLFVASPQGSPSENIGGPIQVTISDIPVAANPGEPSGAPPSGAPTLARIGVSCITVVAKEAAFTPLDIIVSGVPGSAIIPTRLYISASTFITGVGFSFRELRSIVTVDTVNGGLSSLLPHLSISPEAPTASADFPAGTRVDVGDDIFAAAYTQVGSGEQLITVSIMYYREAIT